MEKDYKEFLINLQKELKEQETDGQASPRFWAVRERVKIYGMESGYEDGCEVCDPDGAEIIAENEEEFCEYMNNYDESLNTFCENGYITFKEEDGDEDICFDLQEAVEKFNEIKGKELYLINYREEYKVKENTMFLTKQECKEHIEANSYHYNEPRTYAMTAWRSPQVAKLLEILENVNWEEV